MRQIFRVTVGCFFSALSSFDLLGLGLDSLDRGRIIVSAEASRLAYSRNTSESMDTIAKTYSAYTPLMLPGHRELRGFVALEKYHGKKRIIVSYRGTRGRFDLLQDAKICTRRIRLNNGTITAKFSVHSGFAGRYLDLREQMLHAVSGLVRLHSDIDEITVTGHSLGGAVATFGLFELQRFRNQVGNINLVTFGAPASFVSDDSARSYERIVGRENISRIRRRGDPIPNIVPFINGNCHVGDDLNMTRRYTGGTPVIFSIFNHAIAPTLEDIKSRTFDDLRMRIG